jgi:hypothetical protein
MYIYRLQIKWGFKKKKEEKILLVKKMLTFMDPTIQPNNQTEPVQSLSHIHSLFKVQVEVKVTLQLTVSQSVRLGIEHPCGTCDQILLPVGMLLSEICGLVYMGRPL